MKPNKQMAPTHVGAALCKKSVLKLVRVSAFSKCLSIRPYDNRQIYCSGAIPSWYQWSNTAAVQRSCLLIGNKHQLESLQKRAAKNIIGQIIHLLVSTT